MRSFSSGETRATTTPSRSIDARQDLVVGWERRAEENWIVAGAQPNLGGDGGGGRRMVTRDHGHLDPGSPARCDRLADVMARWVLEREDAEEAEFELHIGGGPGALTGRRSAGDREKPQAASGQRFDHRCALRVPLAQWQHGIRCALDQHGPLDDHRHPPPVGIEWEPGGADHLSPVGVGVDAETAGEDVERCLHGIAVRSPCATVAGDAARRAPDGCEGQPLEAVSGAGIGEDHGPSRVIAGGSGHAPSRSASTPARRSSRWSSRSRSCPCR